MDADKRPLPPYARRGVLLTDPLMRVQPPLPWRPSHRVMWEDFLQPLLRRMNPRKRR